MLLLCHITHAALLCGGCKRDGLQHREAQIPSRTSHALAPQRRSRYIRPRTTSHCCAGLRRSAVHKLSHPTIPTP